nr:hydantoinase/oxoprolinase family protein [Acidimicrobiales bacterium]
AWRVEAIERVSAAGEVLRPLDEAALAHELARLAAEGVESVAVCLLFSFLRPDHERQVGALARAALGPGVHVSLSVDVLPEYREYERTAATVINACVAPLMSRYLSRLAAALAPRRLTIMQSSGGVLDAATAGALAARTVLSGPAGGVVGAHHVAATAGPGGAGFADLITFDMGGTSTDVALCPGRVPLTSDGEIAGLPLRLPMIDIHTVGAGGGSLAWVDSGGALRVGPQSAGADPGPAARRAAAGADTDTDTDTDGADERARSIAADLRRWRADQARKAAVRPTVVLSDRALDAVARHQPRTHADLDGLAGLGPFSRAQHGERLLAIVARHVEPDATRASAAP